MATAYWNNRAILRQAAYDRANNHTVATVSKAFDRTMNQLDIDIDKIMATYTRKTGLTARDAYQFLRDGVPAGVMDELRARAAAITDKTQAKRLGVMLRTDAYRARISRLDAIKASTRVGLSEAAEAELRAITPHLRHTAELAYTRTMFDIQKVTAGFQMVGVPSRALDTILKSKWSGMNYAQSVWANRDAMAGILDRALMEQASMGKLSQITFDNVRGIVDTQAWADKVAAGMKSKFRDEMQYSKYAANRLIRTESAYVANQTTAVAYGECEIEKYEFMATLDNRTSSVCSSKDGEIYVTKEKEVGINWPPLHPHCRSTTAPVIDGLVRENLTRAARDANGKSVYVPRDMKYQEWKAWQEDGAPADIEKWRNKKSNTGTDGKPLFKRIKGTGEQPDGSYVFDLNGVVKEQGFDGLPQIITQAEYDKLISEGSPYMKRGYKAPTQEVLDEYKRQLREGDFYVDCNGGSVYGRGMYTACAENGMKPAAKRFVDNVGNEYGTSINGVSRVEQMTMKPGAKIGMHEDIANEYYVALSNLKSTVYVPDESLRGKIGEAIDLMIKDQRSAMGMFSDIEYDYRSSMATREEAQAAKEAFKDAMRIYTGDGGDVGTMAARLGYDGYDANKSGTLSYRVVLNRTKLVIVE